MKLFLLLLFLITYTTQARSESSGNILDYVKENCKRDLFSGELIVAEENRIVLEVACIDRELVDFANRSYPIGSISKLITSSVLRQLASAGEISLDDSINTYIDHRPESISIKDVMNHRSGIFALGDFLGLVFVLPDHASHALTDLYFIQDKEFRYSNSGYVLLAEVIEKVTGTPFLLAAKQRYLNEIGAINTIIPTTEEQRRGYINTPVGVISSQAIPYLITDYRWQIGGDGAFISTGRDVLKILMNQPIANTGFQSVEGRTFSYGDGIMKIELTDSSTKVFGHNGALSPLGFSSWAFKDHSDRAVVLLTDRDLEPRLDKFYANIWRIMEGQEPETIGDQKRFGIPQVAAILSKYRIDFMSAILFAILLYVNRRKYSSSKLKRKLFDYNSFLVFWAILYRDIGGFLSFALFFLFSIYLHKSSSDSAAQIQKSKAEGFYWGISLLSSFILFGVVMIIAFAWVA